VATGNRDEFAPPDVVEKLVDTWNPATDFSVINGADHFFFEKMEKLSEIIIKNV